MMLESSSRSPRFGRWAFAIACVLLALVFVFASISAYDGAIARKAREYEAYMRPVTLALQQQSSRFVYEGAGSASAGGVTNALDAALADVPHVQHLAIVYKDASGKYRSRYSYGATPAGALATEADVLQTVYPRVNDAMLRAVDVFGGAQLLGRMHGVAGDIIVVASPLVYGDGTRAVALLAFDAGPFARHVVAAATLPLALMTLMYAILTLVYFWLRARVRTLVQEQEYVAFLAHDIRLPLVGIGWATQYLVSGEKRKGIRKEELVQDIATSASVLDEWIKRVIDHTREARGLRGAMMTALTDIDLREILNRVLSVYDLYARARGVSVTTASATPAHIPARGSHEGVERALLQLVAYILTDGAAGEKITVSYHTEPHAHMFDFRGVASFMHTPRGLLQADATLRAYGGELGIYEDEGVTHITFRIPRRA